MTKCLKRGYPWNFSNHWKRTKLGVWVVILLQKGPSRPYYCSHLWCTECTLLLKALNNKYANLVHKKMVQEIDDKFLPIVLQRTCTLFLTCWIHYLYCYLASTGSPLLILTCRQAGSRWVITAILIRLGFFLINYSWMGWITFVTDLLCWQIHPVCLPFQVCMLEFDNIMMYFVNLVTFIRMKRCT